MTKILLPTEKKVINTLIKITSKVMLLVLLSGISISVAQTIDFEKSYVTFEVEKMNVVNLKGVIKGMNGSFKFNPMKLDTSSFDVCIVPSTVISESIELDNAVQSEDYLNTVEYNSICFKSDSIIEIKGKYLAKGKLTLAGTTRDEELIFVFQDNMYIGSMKINRLDYNLGLDIGTLVVSNEVRIKIYCKVN